MYSPAWVFHPLAGHSVNLKKTKENIYPPDPWMHSFSFLKCSLSPIQSVSFNLSMDATPTLSFSLVVSGPLLWYPLNQLLQANAWSDASSWCALLRTASQHTKHSNSVKDKDLYAIANYPKCIQSVIGWLVGDFFPPLVLTFHFMHACIYLPNTLIQVCRQNTTLSLVEACALSGFEKEVWTK